MTIRQVYLLHILIITFSFFAAPALAAESATDAEEIARNVQAMKTRLKGRSGPGARRSPRVSLKSGTASNVGGSEYVPLLTCYFT